MPSSGAILGTAVAGAASVLAVLLLRRKPAKEEPVFMLTNDLGMEVQVTPVGASIMKIVVPDKEGKPVDVVLGYDKPSAYMNADPSYYFGALVGRCANRIAKATFSINGKAYHLTANNGANALHGGKQGLHRRVWEAHHQRSEAGEAVVLRYTSPDGEEGYPGTLNVTVTYELARLSKELRVTITALTDRPTAVNIVQHSYFNLGGHGSGTILDHIATIKGDHFTPVGSSLIPTGEIAPVAGTPFDMTKPTRIGECVHQIANGFDVNYVNFGMGPQAQFIVQNGRAGTVPRQAARVESPKTGITLDVLTSAPGLQFYTGGFIDNERGKGGARYPRFGGLCLETQAFPDSINQPTFPSVLLRPGEMYKHQLVYKFGSGSGATPMGTPQLTPRS